MSGSTHVGRVHSDNLQRGCMANCEDLISILSDDLISNILSRLPTRDALRTSVLSRDWEYKWTSISNIDINEFDDYDTLAPYTATFCNFVDRVLHYSLHVKSFRLVCWRQHGTIRFASWLSAVLRRKIEAVYFKFECGVLLPLKLTALCSENPARICFPNLKSLTLSDVKFLNDNPITDHLIFAFPVLETINLGNCFWSDVKVVEFHAPELTVFKFVGEVDDYTIIFNGGKLKEVKMSQYFPESINNCSSLRKLNLSKLSFKVPSRICFPNLKSLKLWRVKVLNDNPNTDHLVFTFPVLETINLLRCKWSKVKVVEIHAPELTVFKSHTIYEVKDYTISVFGGKLREFEIHGYVPETIIVTGSQVTHAALLNRDLYLDEPFAARQRQSAKDFE